MSANSETIIPKSETHLAESSSIPTVQSEYFTDSGIPKRAPKHWDRRKFEFLTPDDVFDIEELSKGLCEAEAAEFFGLTLAELSEMPYDYWFFMSTFRVGRAKAKASAINSLFKQMDCKNGVPASLEYLMRFGESWPENDSAAIKSGQTFKIEFT